MAGFFYYLPIDRNVVDEHAGKLRREKVEAFQCWHAFEGRDIVPDQTVWHYGEGPDGGAGVLLYPRPFGVGDLPLCTYRPEQQKWLKFQNMWIGWLKDGPLPGPAELRRPVLLPGYEVIDSDGRGWNVPVIRSRDAGRITIPVLHTFDENGRFTTSVRNEDQELWSLSGHVRDYLVQQEDMGEEELTRAAIRFLAVNYHIGIPEVFAIQASGVELLNTTFVARVLGSATDWQLVSEFQKKTGPLNNAAAV